MKHSEARALFKEQNVCVLVPTYNNEQTLERVISDILLYTDQVIVVNDGSTDTTPSILSKFPSIHVVSYAKNKGKGFALRTGFKEALAKGYDSAISIDSDGQHYATDLPEFLLKLKSEQNAIIIGARNMGQSSVPGKSSFGNKFSNFWFWVETGLRMKDTQSGYRLYPIRKMEGLKFLTRKFEFEIEVLVRASWRGIDILHVPVNVFYPETGKRITHFRPFRDVTRITMLNTILVLIAVFFIKPRDFVRSFKKKTPGKLSTNYYLTPTNRTK